MAAKKRKRDYSAIVARRRRTIARKWVLALSDEDFQTFIRSVGFERLHREVVRKAVAHEIKRGSRFLRLLRGRGRVTISSSTGAIKLPMRRASR